MQFWTALLEHLRGGEAAFLALVADNTAHSPGTRGARIFVRPDATTHGTIGGGIMEADLVELGLDALSEGRFQPDYQVLYHRDKGKGDKSGLICAGHQTNVYYLCQPGNDLDVLEEVARREEADQAGLLQIGPEGMRLVDEETISRERPPIRLVDDEDGWRY